MLSILRLLQRARRVVASPFSSHYQLAASIRQPVEVLNRLYQARSSGLGLLR
jgi:hypothetical protein